MEVGFEGSPSEFPVLLAHGFMMLVGPAFMGAGFFKDHVTFQSYLKPTGHFRSSSARCASINLLTDLGSS